MKNTVMSVIAAGLAVAVVGSTQTAGADPADVATATATVNTARARYGAGPLTWNDTLVEGITKQADGCRFQHSPGAIGGRYGENIYASAGRATVGDAVTAWMAEARYYDYNNPVFSHRTGHFTAMVWKSSTGFAILVKPDCPAGSLIPGSPGPQSFVIARFTPPGNVRGRFAENVGRPSPAAP